MPNAYIIGGANGAGKTTTAFELFPELDKSIEFVNADFIAKGLSAFNNEAVALTAGRLMLRRIDVLKSSRQDFAFESTLASRSFVTLLNDCKKAGYHHRFLHLG